MKKNVKPFNQNFSIEYQNIGKNDKKKKDYRSIENMRYRDVTTNKEEIDLCLTCPYPKCVSRCERLANFRKEKVDDY